MAVRRSENHITIPTGEIYKGHHAQQFDPGNCCTKGFRPE